jgi:nucleotide-binding universal stress UspA family protein
VLPYALDFAKRVAAEVTFVRVVPGNLAEASEWGAVGRRPASASAPSQETVNAERYLGMIAVSSGRGGIKINTELRHGDPATEILRAASDVGADTIAIATHSRRGIDRLVFGSVAERVVHGTPLPVIVIRPKSE